MWGLIAVCAGLVVAAWIVVLHRQSTIEKRRRREAAQRRYSIADTGERVPLAGPREATPPAASPSELPVLPEVAAFLSPEAGDGALIQSLTEATDPLGEASPATVVGGRMVTTPDGEMILTNPPFSLRETVLNRREAAYAAAIRERMKDSGAADTLVLCPKVRLEALVTPTPPDGRDASDWRQWRKRVRLRAVDLVVCDTSGGGWRPVLAIEVDRPITLAQRVGGGVDRMVDEVLGAVGLPLVRCKGDPESDWGMIEPYLRGEVSASAGTE